MQVVQVVQVVQGRSAVQVVQVVHGRHAGCAGGASSHLRFDTAYTQFVASLSATFVATQARL